MIPQYQSRYEIDFLPHGFFRLDPVQSAVRWSGTGRTDDGDTLIEDHPRSSRRHVRGPLAGRVGGAGDGWRLRPRGGGAGVRPAAADFRREHPEQVEDVLAAWSLAS